MKIDNKISKNNSSIPLISIITVVYNSCSFLENTIKSVINQSYSNIEYIIIDGNSTDGTKKIIDNYSEYISVYISENDNGLYDAMNKGINNANGDYIWFMNAGDLIHNDNTISDIFKNLNSLPDVIYGETDIIDTNWNIIGNRRLSAPKELNWKCFRKGMLVSHQSLLVKKDISVLYNLKYKLSADFDWVINILKKSNQIHNSNLVLSKFMDGGLTKKNISKGLVERFNIMTKNYGFFQTLFTHLYISFRFFFFVSKHKRF